jgi:hypothetical protein
VNGDLSTFALPLTIMAGGGLVAFGLMSLIGFNYFKTKTQGAVALAIGLSFLLVTQLLVMTSGASGQFFSGQKLGVTDCQLDGEANLPLERDNKSPVIQNYIVQCMDKAGYEWTASNDNCRDAPLATNAFCYLPKGPFDRTLVAFQMKFE